MIDEYILTTEERRQQWFSHFQLLLDTGDDPLPHI